MYRAKCIGVLIGVVRIRSQACAGHLIDGVLFEDPDATEHRLGEAGNWTTLVGIKVLEGISIGLKALVVAYTVRTEYRSPADSCGQIVIFPASCPNQAVIVCSEVPGRRDKFIVPSIF